MDSFPGAPQLPLQYKLNVAEHRGGKTAGFKMETEHSLSKLCCPSSDGSVVVWLGMCPSLALWFSVLVRYGVDVLEVIWSEAAGVGRLLCWVTPGVCVCVPHVRNPQLGPDLHVHSCHTKCL